MNRLLPVTVMMLIGGNVALAQSTPPAGQTLPPDQRFKQLDTNADGKVSFEEFKIGRTEELKNSPQPGAQSAPVMSIEDTFKTIDTNADGSISKEEFFKRFADRFPGGVVPPSTPAK